MKKAALVTITTLACLLLAESSLRLFAPPETVYALDDVYLHRLVPNSSKVFVHHRANGGASVEVKINSLGFRDDEFAREPAAGRKRIIVYGDSFVEAEFTPLERSFTKQLERHLTGAGRGVEVINAGVVAYGPDQSALRIEAEAEELKPDLVVLAIFAGNDFGDLLRNKIYRLDAEGELVKNDYTISPALRREFRPPRSLLLLKARQAYGNLRALVAGGGPSPKAYVGQSVRRCREDCAEYVAGANNEVKNLFRDQYDADISLKTDTACADYKKRLMERVVGKIKSTLDARGVPLVLVIIPAVTDLFPGYEISVDRNVYKDYDPAALTDALQHIAVSNDLRHVNLFDAFKAADPSALYFKYPNAHWNEEGQRLAAVVTGDLIVSSGLVD